MEWTGHCLYSYRTTNALSQKYETWEEHSSGEHNANAIPKSRPRRAQNEFFPDSFPEPKEKKNVITGIPSLK
jgi:hypothetical protein